MVNILILLQTDLSFLWKTQIKCTLLVTALTLFMSIKSIKSQSANKMTSVLSEVTAPAVCHKRELGAQQWGISSLILNWTYTIIQKRMRRKLATLQDKSTAFNGSWVHVGKVKVQSWVRAVFSADIVALLWASAQTDVTSESERPLLLSVS